MLTQIHKLVGSEPEVAELNQTFIFQMESELEVALCCNRKQEMTLAK